MLHPKTIIIATCCVVAIIVGIYFVGRYTIEQNTPDNNPVPSTEEINIPTIEQKSGPTAKEHSHGDVGHDETQTAQDAPTIPNTADPSVLTLSGPPVDALRTQTQKLGHWSAEFIPPFPPDDLEAAAIAEAVFIVVANSVKHGFYENAQIGVEYPRSPEVDAAWQLLQAEREARLAEMLSTGVTPRLNDLAKLSLPLEMWTTPDMVENWPSEFDNQ